MVKYVTAESVTIGHPDKLCDYIADSILDEALKADPNARVACEVMASKGEITVAGEITMNRLLPYDDIVYNALLEAGYGTDYALHFNIHTQSLDIKNGVDKSLEQRTHSVPVDEYDRLGAGDQGIVLGYACDETPELMPLPITLAHGLAKRLQSVRENGEVEHIKPDGKTQVTVKYVDGEPVGVNTVLISTQHDKVITHSELFDSVLNNVITPVWQKHLLFVGDIEDGVLVNPSGNFIEGGPAADTGLTGRKLMVDTYGGGHHGGGAFSGKDPTKVDRSGAYMARYIAKAIVMTKLTSVCEVQIAYAIGTANPISVYVDTYGSKNCDDERLTEAVKKVFDMRPAAIIDRFKLRRPIYKQTAAYGHFGNPDFPWEKVDLSEVSQLLKVYRTETL